MIPDRFYHSFLLGIWKKEIVIYNLETTVLKVSDNKRNYNQKPKNTDMKYKDFIQEKYSV